MEERSHRHILNLVTQMAVIGLSGNEIGCALIPMMARNISFTLRPNTLTHDQHPYLEYSSCNTRPVHTFGSKAVIQRDSRIRPYWGQEQT